jgi:DNA-binding transcriptional ArsR family regulator
LVIWLLAFCLLIIHLLFIRLTIPLTFNLNNRNITLMGLSKTEIFTKQQNEMAIYAKALGHPARIAILQHLVRINECVCGDLVDEIGLAQATISQHLKELKNAGIIKGTISGTSVCYCIDADVWNRLRNDFDGFFEAYTNCC